MVEIKGRTDPAFSAVREAFEANFAEGEELGARFTLVRKGEIVVDLIGGYTDRSQAYAYDETTLTPIFSCTKALMALMMARLVDQGRLDYEQTVASVWPEFAQAGKAAVTIGQLLSHQSGLSGVPEKMDPDEWFDWDGVCARLAAQAPLWPPGTASGYHPLTIGYLAGEVFRRVDGRSMADAFHEDVADPFGLDIFIGLPASEESRTAEIQKPRAAPSFGDINGATKAAFLTTWSGAAGKNSAEWRRQPIPSANGHATAQSLARLMGALAGDGTLDGKPLLSPPTIALASRQRIRGQDLVLPYEISWGAGFMRNETITPWGPGLETFGHAGWGGSCVFADPERGLAGAYVMNRQSPVLLGDRRPKRLIEAAY